MRHVGDVAPGSDHGRKGYRFTTALTNAAAESPAAGIEGSWSHRGEGPAHMEAPSRPWQPEGARSIDGVLDVVHRVVDGLAGALGRAVSLGAAGQGHGQEADQDDEG